VDWGDGFIPSLGPRRASDRRKCDLPHRAQKQLETSVHFKKYLAGKYVLHCSHGHEPLDISADVQDAVSRWQILSNL